jgi:uncharacterized membrane protein YcaP (DUF421 family)
MDWLVGVDWEKVLVPKLSVLEMLIRGAAVYVALVLILRAFPRRQAGQISTSDLLVIGLVAGVARNALAADGYSIPDGLGVCLVVLACSHLVNWLSYHSPFVHRLTRHSPVQLVKDGRVLHDRLREELLTEGRLISKLRAQGVTDPGEVAEAWMEGDGQISVVKKQPPPPVERNGFVQV